MRMVSCSLVFLMALGAMHLSAHVTELTSAAEAKEALKSQERPAAIKFYADWCGACKMFKKSFDEAAESYAGRIDCYAANVDKVEIKDFVKEHSVRALPTTEIYVDGKMHDRFEGARSKEDVERAFEKALEMKGEKKEEKKPEAKKEKKERKKKEAAPKKERKPRAKVEKEEAPCHACHEKA